SLFRKGMKMILEIDGQIEVTETAENGLELLKKIENGGIDAEVILLDLSMPVLDGIDTLLQLNELHISQKVIILTSHYNESIIIKLIDEGASGFLAKNENPDEVINTIINVAKKGFHINDFILQLVRNRRLLAKKKMSNEKLSNRELEVLQLICDELTTKEIAGKLFISPRTVEGHRNRILEKTQSKNTAGLVIYAIEHNIIDVAISKYK
ncbi:MAG: response regulator transcription factor, partial [Saprospiraceae bacterium]